MKLKKGNIFNHAPSGNSHEVFTTLFESQQFKIESITGLRSYDRPGEWYDQLQDEWVILLQGNAMIEIRDEEIIELEAGDYIFLPAHKVHRVNQTSKTPHCIWLAIHGNFK